MAEHKDDLTDLISKVYDSKEGQYKEAKKKLNDYDDKVYNYVKSGTKAADEEKKKAAKALANHLWYLANKDKKKAYNEKYYQENIDYWKKQYEEQKKLRDKELEGIRVTYDWHETALENNRPPKDDPFFDDYNKDVDNRIKEHRAKRDAALKRSRQISDAEVDLVGTNLKRAYREYQEFLDSQKKMSFGEAWKSGAKSIVNTGKGFINKLLGR